MAVTNLYSNLPGHLVEFKDGGLQLTSTNTDTSSTKSLLILGTATDGPINEPVKIDSVTVSQVFGKEVNADGYPNGATLTKYAKQAFKNGFDDVRCMRVTGSQAYTTITGQQTTSYVTRYDGEIKGTDAVDGTGEVKGNEAYSYRFTEDPSNPCFVSADANDLLADNSGETAHFVYDDGTGAQATQGLTVQGKFTWSPYQGFDIAANQFASLADIKLKCNAIIFTGNTVDNTGDTNLAKKQVENLNVTEDTTTSVLNNIEVTLINNTLFTSTTAHSDFTPKLPEIVAGYLNNDGFHIEKADGSALVEGTDYTGAFDDATNPTKYVITPISGGALADGDTIVVTYYPYRKDNLELTFADKIVIPDSTLDISEIASKENGTITSITVGNNVYTATSDKFTKTSTTLKVSDASGMAVGDKISVVYSYDEPITYDLELKIKSQFGGSLYKDGTVEVRKMIDGTNQFTEIVFTRPSAKTTSQTTKTYSYSSKYYNTIDDLILAMKNDMNNLNMFEVEIVKGEGTDSLNLLDACPAKTLDQGGEDGLKPSNDEMFKALSGVRYTLADIGTPISPWSSAVVTQDMVGFLKTQGAYQILENYNVDYIYPAGIYADSVQNVNPNSDFQRELALVCAVLTYRTKMTHGFIDVKPNSNTTLVGIDAYVAKLINSHNNLYYMTDQDGNIIYDADNKPMDIGWYTSVVVGPEPVMSSDVLGTYYGSPAIAYAALNAVLEPQSSPLNKALRNVNGMKFKFSNKQMDAIIGNRMVCFKLKNEGMATASSTPYVVDGVTAGAPGCDYSDIAIVKVVTDVVDNIRQVADPFIGEQNTVEQRNALSALISKRLSKLVELGEIMSYEFEVSATIQQQLLGEASIALTIIPAMTLKKITTVVALRAAE